MTEILIREADLNNVKGKVAIVTGEQHYMTG
jgi:hypothetical protein